VSVTAPGETDPRLDDERFMRRALELAARGRGKTNPNPMVGCVIVRDGRVVGEGFHARAGRAHAELLALEQAGSEARGADLFVTLEPCAHQGRTPACAPRVAAARPRRVVVAQRDPNPLVNGRGLRMLRKAGIETRVGILEPEALLLNERFVTAARRQRPFVLLKAALTLDGRIATARGDSRWVTSPAQRRQARALRGLHDGVLVGIGTVLADDPLLLPEPRVGRPFLRVVLDSHLRLPLASRLVCSVARGPIVVLCRAAPERRRRELERRGVLVLCEADEAKTPHKPAARVSLDWALSALWQRGLWSVMVEGGAEVLGSFLNARHVDQIALFRAPLLLGGRGSKSAFGGPDPARIDDALRLTPRSPLARRGGPAAPDLLGEPALFELWYPY
jgi:diaminohydroxyphosphoribosylaminopyrimidine deaminase / 5-amino-6-(5-phosphoribosylamino)uracil reductase